MTSLWLDGRAHVETDALIPGSTVDDVVVGAGLTGLVTALLLTRSGRRVVVLEARRVGAVTTGNTTAKVSVLQGTRLTKILRTHSMGVAQAYVDGNREGQAWLLHYCDEHGIAYQRRDAVSYAGTLEGTPAARAEYDAASRLGLDVEWVDELDLPFPTFGGVRLADQAQFDPMDVLTELASDVRERGGLIVDGARVLGVDGHGPRTVRSTVGDLDCENVIIATGTPVLDRGLYFAKLRPERSYAMSYRVPGPIPSGMYLSVDSPTRSLRTAPTADGELLLVGGNGHVVGRESATSHNVADLESWTQRYFAGAQRTHRWSAQDYESINAVPFVGAMPRGGGKIYVATGFGKWGMTNAPAAALRLAGLILGGHMEWADTLGHRVTKPTAALTALEVNGSVAVEIVKGWVNAELHRDGSADAEPAEGTGVVRSEGLRPVAVSTVDGVTCKIAAHCTHLAGIVTWNEVERSWDCPLHGSRFTADGTVLEGPATKPLERLG
jgi:glycine/D-amino acid oxidase-like deaminating enzyme/nitrite reductase/ring-hydroxylating ferredoxin subunit